MSIPSSQHPFEPKWIATGVSKGIAVGAALILKPRNAGNTHRSFESVDAELSRLEQALNHVVINLKALIEKTEREVGSEEAQIFEAHLMMIQDDELTGPIRAAIQSDRVLPEVAAKAAFQTQIEVFQSADSDYLKERALDLKDLLSQLLDALDPSMLSKEQFSQAGIIIAEDLTPSQTLLLDRSQVLGIITEKGGETSHSAIIARTLGIPAITGVKGALNAFQNSSILAIDGKEGSVFVIPNAHEREYFEARAREFLSEMKGLEDFKGKPSVTHDQHAIRLMANVGGTEDTKSALDFDAEGVGLFRTEFLFMGKPSAPTLEEQTRAYREVLSMMAPREVIIRTLDVGGDKPIDYIRIQSEENPFLGVRAIRYCLKDLPLFKTQIKAMLLANEWGNLSIMLPMVSRASEATTIRALVDECHAELLSDKNYKANPYQLGAMVEIPSLIFEMKELRKSVSFVSVGTNDLMQYSYAVDRMNPDLKDLYTPYHLGFMRMMNLLAKEALDQGLSLGICGELGGQDDLLPLWVAMGYQKLSMTPIEVLAKRRLLSKLTVSACQGLLREVLEAPDGTQMKWILEEFQKGVQ